MGYNVLYDVLLVENRAHFLQLDNMVQEVASASIAAHGIPTLGLVRSVENRDNIVIKKIVPKSETKLSYADVVKNNECKSRMTKNINNDNLKIQNIKNTTSMNINNAHTL